MAIKVIPTKVAKTTAKSAPVAAKKAATKVVATAQTTLKVAEETESPKLINRKGTREFILTHLAKVRPTEKYTRVSKETLDHITEEFNTMLLEILEGVVRGTKVVSLPSPESTSTTTASAAVLAADTGDEVGDSDDESGDESDEEGTVSEPDPQDEEDDDREPSPEELAEIEEELAEDDAPDDRAYKRRKI